MVCLGSFTVVKLPVPVACLCRRVVRSKNQVQEAKYRARYRADIQQQVQYGSTTGRRHATHIHLDLPTSPPPLPSLTPLSLPRRLRSIVRSIVHLFDFLPPRSPCTKAPSLARSLASLRPSSLDRWLDRLSIAPSLHRSFAAHAHAAAIYSWLAGSTGARLHAALAIATAPHRRGLGLV
jgi:hypothetical protein